MFFISYKITGLPIKNTKIKLNNNKLYIIFFNKKLKLKVNKFFHYNNYLVNLVNKSDYFQFLFFKKLKLDWFLGEYFGFCHKLVLEGLGFKFLKFKSFLIIKLGTFPSYKFKIPRNISIVLKTKQEIELYSKNKIVLYNFFYLLRNLKKINPYTLKGIYSYKQPLKKKVSSKLSSL